MLIFWSLILKILPLYLLIGMGYLAARKLHVQRETVARLLIYLVAPMVIFYGAYQAPLTWAVLSIPLLFCAISSIISLLFLLISRWFWHQDPTGHLLSFAAATGNTGYFGLPVIFILLGEQAFSVAVLVILGMIMYENTLGFFLVARGRHTTRESLLRITKLPALYAFVFGLGCHFVQLPLSTNLLKLLEQFKGAYTILGMMIIGIGLAQAKWKDVDLRFISFAFVAKFLVWPLLMGGLIMLDLHFFHFYNSTIYNVLIIMSLVPLAANSVAFAIELNVHPEKAATAVFLSTIFALFYIPLITAHFLF